MNAIPYESHQDDWDRDDGVFEEELPGRPRRRLLNRWSALLFALIVGGAGFYAGIRVEKGQLSNSSSSLGSAFASRFGGAGTSTTGAGGSSTTGTSGAGGSSSTGRTGASSSSRFPGGFGGAAGLGGFAGLGGGSATVGTISSVDGNTIYVTDTSGNTVKVKLSSVTKISKSLPVSKQKVYPGDSVVIAGVKASNGTVTATTLSDSGTRSTGSGTSGSSGASSSGSAISSLF